MPHFDPQYLPNFITSLILQKFLNIDSMSEAVKASADVSDVSSEALSGPEDGECDSDPDGDRMMAAIRQPPQHALKKTHHQSRKRITPPTPSPPRPPPPPQGEDIASPDEFEEDEDEAKQSLLAMERESVSPAPLPEDEEDEAVAKKKKKAKKKAKKEKRKRKKSLRESLEQPAVMGSPLSSDPEFGGQQAPSRMVENSPPPMPEASPLSSNDEELISQHRDHRNGREHSHNADRDYRRDRDLTGDLRSRERERYRPPSPPMRTPPSQARSPPRDRHHEGMRPARPRTPPMPTRDHSRGPRSPRSPPMPHRGGHPRTPPMPRRGHSRPRSPRSPLPHRSHSGPRSPRSPPMPHRGHSRPRSPRSPPMSHRGHPRSPRSPMPPMGPRTPESPNAGKLINLTLFTKLIAYFSISEIHKKDRMVIHKI